MTKLTLSRALNEGLRRALEDNPKVLIMGEDVGRLGGVFRVTDGLQKDFGEHRVVDTPLAESGIVGTAIGLALRGYRPVCEIQFDGFVYPAVDQIVSQLAKMRYRSRGNIALPVVIRIPFGGGIGAVEHHSESPEVIFAHTAGLRVVACSDPADAFTMIQQSVRCDDPVIFLEPKRRYWDKAEVDTARDLAEAPPLDVARTVLDGSDVTLLGYGPMVKVAVAAATAAGQDGRSIEVIDLRSLSPLDMPTIAASVRRTGRCVVAHEAPVFAGFGAEIAARVTEECFYHLEAPVLRVGGFSTPYPPSRLEEHYLPDLDRVLDAVDRTFAYLSGRAEMTEIRQFRLPDVGEGLTEADIVSWRVKPGDRVSANQTIVEIETAKSLVELPSPFDGVVTELLVDEGQTVDVGTPIIAVDTSGAATAGGTGPAQQAQPAAAAPPEGAAGDQPSTPTGESAVTGQGTTQTAEGMGRGAPTPERESQSVLVGYGVKPSATTRRKRKPGYVPAPPGTAPAAGRPAAPPRAAATPRDVASPQAPSPQAAATAPAATPPQAAPGAPQQAAAQDAPGVSSPASPPLAKPPVRKLAKNLGVDLAELAGSGPGGSITRDDVQRAAERATTAGSAETSTTSAGPGPAGLTGVPGWATADGRREERVPVRGVRKHTAAAMTASAFTAPHVTEFLQVDVTETMDAVRRIRELPEFAGARVSPLLLVARALLLAVGRHPAINSSWDEAAGEIVVKRYVNLGIAAATDRGLLVPNVKDAHTLTLPALARALTDLVATARDGRCTPADLTGGTITITNVGVFGVDAGTPILTPGESAILAFGQVREVPWVRDGQVVARRATTLSLSFDHRVVDGDLGSAVLRDVGAMLEDPIRMLAWA